MPSPFLSQEESAVTKASVQGFGGGGGALDGIASAIFKDRVLVRIGSLTKKKRRPIRNEKKRDKWRLETRQVVKIKREKENKPEEKQEEMLREQMES